jgi:two-component system, chemotaxis family, CheB/CheR fusion protein
VLTFVDMTERKAMETQQRLLLRELTHRVKNTLAVVQSIAHQTRRSSKAYEEFTDRLDGRLAALAAAHTLLVDSEWRGADLATLAQKQVEPHIGGKSDRIKITGEPIFLPADLATPFALVFHELATNAAKHGAFSRRTGSVELGWKQQSKNGQPLLMVTWRERGGPKTAAPKTKGFGSELIERAIPNSTVRREFASDGVTCTFEVQLPKAS